ncbi:MFS transporter [Algibacillus agarilyticus]|uniref:MFS transporter n=1 Tax=Algibacillus agarilyticus TaxID=2234133 RepID=UPI000DCF7E42|nr:glycoside-pentoside-hexuronide (GPH):cation symporter [Algibacillus agarilyticus]
MVAKKALSAEHLSFIEKIGYGAGDFAINIAYSSMMLLITYFYTDIYHLTPIDLGIMFVVVRTADAMLTPIMGYLTDTFSSKWGRYRHYFILLALPFGASIILTFTTPDLDYDGKLLWAYCTYGFFSLMFTAVTIPYISILSVMTENREARLSASGYRLFMAKLAAFLVVTIVPIMTASNYLNGNLSHGYQVVMTTMALIAVVCLIFCFVFIQERVQLDNMRINMLQQVKLVLANKLLMLLSASCVVSTMGFMIRGALAIYFAKYCLNLGSFGQSLFLVTNVLASILAMVASTWITKRYSKIKLYYKSQIIAGLLSLGLYVFAGQDAVVFAFIVFFLLSFVVDLHAPIFWAAIADAVDYGSRTLGTRVTGLSYCMISMSQKLAIGLAGAVVGFSLTYFGYNAQDLELSVTTSQGIVFMFAFIPAGLHILVGSIMKRYQIVRKEESLAKHKFELLIND